ncbi:MAG: thiamine pyrophosphate-dependent dehydrogenase E1 component subunit alpha [Anaerolineae bacterium]|nr:thiamine pyrophosphate-dependent dehydrogenase E1 component subunit alpha [Anaerolineae bacterium]
MTDLQTPPQTAPTLDDDGVALEPRTLREMYWHMLRARRLDERAWVMHRQGKIAFHISGIGHEAIQVGAAYAIRPGYDYLHLYYRDLALNLAVGYTPRDFMLALLGKEGEPTSGARQMPSHWGSKDLNIVSGSSPVATQVPQAAGMALAAKLRGEDRLALTTLGEGSTSQGDFFEGLNWAGVHKLPLICIVQNNIYAISVPMEMQMAVPNVADRAAMFGVVGVIVDGNDVLACYREVKAAADRARRGDGATLIEAKTYRPVPHSSDDDDRSYRSREEVELWKQRDPVERFRAYLLARGIISEDNVAEFEQRAREEVDAAQAAAEAAPYPAPERALGNLFAPDEV